MPPADETWAPKSTRLRYPPMAVGFRARLGALAERDFRLLFAGTTITTFGDALGGIALAFAVLELPGASATDLGIVIATRQAADAAVLLAGGVLSDRLPRNLVLVGASLVQGVAQSATAALVLTGEATVGLLVALAALYGIGHGLIVPAEVGLVPQTVRPERLQQANALQGLSRNIVFALGPAVGGVLVVAGSPGVALAADAASFFVCAALLQRIRIPRRPDSDRAGVLARAARGLARVLVAVVALGHRRAVRHRESRVGGLHRVLGPAIAKAELGGAGAWAVILSARGRRRDRRRSRRNAAAPSRPLFVSCVAPVPIVFVLAGLAVSFAHLGPGSPELPRRRGDRDPPHPLVHGLPATGAGARAIAGELLRRARLVRADPARRGHRRAGRRGDRNGRHALGGRRDQRRLSRRHRVDPSVWAIRPGVPEPETA